MANPGKNVSAKVEPSCRVCRWGSTRNGSTFIECGVDLPPHIQTSNDYRRHLVNMNYVCALFRGK